MPWTLKVRDHLLVRQGEVSEYVEFTAIRRFNDVGTWTLTMDGRTPTAELLLRPDWGIELLTQDGHSVFSGPVTNVDRTRDQTTDLITFTGTDDMICLRDRLVHPQPGTSVPPYSSTEYDVMTDVGSTVLRHYVDVNLGPNAIAPRRVYNLTLATPDPLAGATITGRGRYQNLLTFLQERALEAGGLGFKLEKQETPELQFFVYTPTDRTASVVFSVDRGTLASYQYGRSRPEATYVYVGGEGEGTARTIRESQDPAESVLWNRRIETFVDRRDATTDAELDAEGVATLATGKSKARLDFVPIDVWGAAYLVDYDLGDEVTAVLDTELVDVIREVSIVVKPDYVRVLPVLGTPSSDVRLRSFQQIAALRERVTHLERR